MDKQNSEKKLSDKDLVDRARADLVASETAAQGIFYPEAGDHALSGTSGQWNNSVTQSFVRTDQDENFLASDSVPSQFGDYQILGVLGRGGMGVVYKARQPALNRVVALKMIRSGTFADERELIRFQNEVEAVATLDHPHIVPVLELGQVGVQKFFTMKFIDGGTLTNRIHEYFSDPRSAAKLMVPISQALHHAHQRGILHRDLKPSNILLDRAGLPYVSDFGLARRLDGKSAMTATGEALGTPSYMAPEQAMGRIHEIGVATDVYGLGAILYAMLTNQAPFQANSVLETLELVKKGAVKPPSSINPKTPRDLEIICLKCLQHDPKQRYESADALANDLSHFLAGLPLKAKPVGNAQKLWMWTKRNPLVAALSASATLLLISTAAISTWSAIHLSNKNNVILRANHEIEQKNEELEKQRDLADRSRILAEERAQLALESYQYVITEIEKELSTLSEATEVRRRVLLLSAERLRKLAVEMSKTSKAQPTLAHALVKLADLLKKNGDSKEALQLCKEAYSLVNDRTSIMQGTADSKYNAVLTLSMLANLHREIERDLQLTEQLYLEAIDYCRDLRRHPEDLQSSEEVTLFDIAKVTADIQVLRSGLYLSLGKPTESLTSSQEALDAINDSINLVSSEPDEKLRATKEIELKRLKGKHLFSMANGLTHRDEVKAATEAWKEAQATFDQLTQQTRSAADMIMKAGVSASYGWFELTQGRTQEAIELLDNSRKIYELIEKARPSVDSKNKLGIAYYRLAIANQQAGNRDESERLIKACLEVRENLYSTEPDNVRWKKFLALALARAGNTDKAKEFAQQLLDEPNIDVELRFDLARVFAMLAVSNSAESSHWNELALEQLSLAVEQGYADSVALRQEPDLSPLRNEERFQQLISKLQQK